MKCRVCGHNQLTRIHTDHDAAEYGEWYRCWGCGSESNSLPSAEYTETYYDANQNNLGSFEKCIEAQTTNFDLMERHVNPDLMSLTFLDVGCHDCSALVGMQRRGWRVSGFDIHSEVERRALALGINSVKASGAHLANTFFPIRFSAVLCREVIEHVDDWPFLMLHVGRLVAPGGILQLQTPAPSPHWHQNVYQRWHLQIFSLAMLRISVMSQGFDVEDELHWTGDGMQAGQCIIFRKK